MRRNLRLVAIVLAAFLGTVVLAICAALVFIQTGPGARWLASELARAISGPGATAEIDGLRGAPPFHLVAGEIRLSDPDGPWLTIRDAQLDIAGAALLHRSLDITLLRASDIEVTRLPAGGPSERHAEPARFAIPQLPVDVSLSRLAIDRLALAAPVIGEPAAMQIAGDARIAPGAAEAHLTVDRTDGQPGSAKLALALAGTPPKLDLSLEISEPTGGVTQRFLHRDDRPPLAVLLNGSGPTTGWHGKLIATVGNFPALDATIDMAAEPSLRAAISGEAHPADFIPTNLIPIVGDALRFSAAAEIGADDILRVTSLKLADATTELDASGQFDQGSQKIEGSARVSVADLAPAGALTPAPLGGEVRLEARLSGSPQRPSLDLDITGSQDRYDDARAGQVQATLHLAAADASRSRWQLSGQGRFADLTEGGRALPADLGQPISWSFQADLDAQKQSLALTHLSATGAGLDLEGAGALSRQASNGNLTLHIADLAMFGGLAGLPQLGGQLGLDARVETDAVATATAIIHATGQDLRFGKPAVDAALGPRPELSAEATRNRAGDIELKSLTLSGAAAKADASGSFSASDGRLAGKLTASVAELQSIAAPVGSKLRGYVAVTADASGTLDKPAITAEIRARDLGGARPIFRSLSAELRVDDLRNPSGTLDADFQTPEMKGRIETQLGRPSPDRLSLSKLSATAGGARVDGQIDYSLSSRRASGKLIGKVPDLRPWSRLAGTALAGRADLSLTLSARDGQAAELTFSAADLAMGQGAGTMHVGRVNLTGKATALDTRPRGTLVLAMANIAAGTARLAKANLKAGTQASGAIAFSGESSGELVESATRGGPRGQPLSLSYSGDWTSSGGLYRVTMSKLDAKLGSDSAKLRQPAHLTYGPREYRLENLALDIAGGEVSGSASLAGDRLAAKLAAAHLSLEPFARLASRPMSGTIDLQADLSGTTEAPSGRIALSGHNLHLASADARRLPPFSLDGELIPSREQLGVQLTIASAQAKLVTATGTVPFRLNHQALAIAIPNDRPMSLKISGEGRLEVLAQALPLGEDRIAGHYQLALDIAGTLKSPDARGRLSIDGGRYTSRAFGTDISGITAELTGDRSELRLTRFDAGDGNSGKINASGAVDLAAKPEARIDFQAAMSQFRIANSDQARASADGEVRVTGGLSEPKLYARLRVPKGDFRIPDHLPTSVVKLDVIEIDSRLGQQASATPTATSAPPAAKPAMSVALDAEIDIPGQAFVRGRGLDSEWRGTLKIAGTSDQPAITGGLEIVHGSVNLLGKSFGIRRGTITFPGGLSDPQLDVLAEAVTADVTAQVTLTGSASAPKLQLTSQPQLPQDEILARVLFGKNAGQITPAQGLQLAYAASTLAGGGPDVIDKLRRATGLDRLTLGTDTDSNALGPPQVSRNTTGNTSAVPSVSGGKYIAPGVFVGVEEGADPNTGNSTPTTRSKVEIEITPQISAESRMGADGSTEVGIGWKRDY